MNNVQVGDIVRIGRVTINDGDAEDFVRFLADNINKDLTVVRVVNEQRGITVKGHKDNLEDFDLDELKIR